MAGYKMAGRYFPIFRINLEAFFCSDRAAGIEIAAVGRVDRAGDIPFKENAVTVSGFIRVRDRNSSHERLGIGMKWFQINIIPIRQFHYLPKIHNNHAVADMANHAEVMRDE